MILSLNSCAPTPPSHAWGKPGQAASARSIDPRFIGTWVGSDKYGTNVITLSPDGRGRVHTRKRGKFDHAKIKWTTRSNIIELRRGASWTIGNDSGYTTFNSGFTLRLPSGSVSNHRRRKPLPDSVFRLAVTSQTSRKIITNNIASPRSKMAFYKYSDKPIYDPYPVYNWFDVGSHKKYDPQPE